MSESNLLDITTTAKIRHMRPSRAVYSRFDRHVHTNHGGVTVATHITPSGAMYVALSVCSLDDNFSRAVGREFALHRLCECDIIALSDARVWMELDKVVEDQALSDIGRLYKKLSILTSLTGLTTHVSVGSRDRIEQLGKMGDV